MRKAVLLAAMAALIVVANAGAMSVYVSRIDGYYTSPGGEFNVSPVIGGGYSANALVNNGFETFCMETDVGIFLPGTYDASTSQTASDGKALTVGVAWLYSQFAQGILQNYDYSTSVANGTFANRAAAAWDLQNAIWALQGQSVYAASTYYLPLAETQFGGTLADAQVASGGAYAVNVVNLVDANGAPVQNMLSLPDGGTTAMLLGMALAGLGLVSRKLLRA